MDSNLSQTAAPGVAVEATRKQFEEMAANRLKWKASVIAQMRAPSGDYPHDRYLNLMWLAWSTALLAGAAGGEPVGEVGTMPGTEGFTMACFKASDVPVGTKLYAAPPAPVVAQGGVTDAEVEKLLARLSNVRAFHLDGLAAGTVDEAVEMLKSLAASRQGTGALPASERLIKAAKTFLTLNNACAGAEALDTALKEYLAATQPSAAPAGPTDPMDTPLPCDVTVGHGTMRKGVPLRSLVSRMKTLYEMATGNNADEVAGRSIAERSALFEKSPFNLMNYEVGGRFVQKLSPEAQAIADQLDQHLPIATPPGEVQVDAARCQGCAHPAKCAEIKDCLREIL